ncbi:MAG: flagellar basal body-associated FliL family protein [Pararhodobacter sp.]|nr:flagellar basal body-associated FliL family protein [Pararhodobacter sp.]
MLLPILLALVGLLAGTGAGWFMRPAPPEPESAEATTEPVDTAPAQTETLRLPSQFLVPVIHDGRMRAMVVIGLALEVEAGQDITLARHEARLRAAFLQAMFDHANLGGFDGVFTSGEVLHGLRRALRDIARAELGTGVHDVLITDLVRQES